MHRLILLISFMCATVGVAVDCPGAILSYYAHLNGPSESPPVNSPGVGFVTVDYNNIAHTLAINAIWSGLIGTTTVAHIHAPTAVPFAGTVGVAVTPGTLPGFPTGVTAGSYSFVADLTINSTYTGGFRTLGGGTASGAEALLANSLANGQAYFNIHSSFVGSGEIRGFLVPTPEPASIFAWGAMAMAIPIARRWHRRIRSK